MAKDEKVDTRAAVAEAHGANSELLDSGEVAEAKQNGLALSPEDFEATRVPVKLERAPGAKDGAPVGSVNVTTLDPDFGKRVIRVPVFEGDDPEEVRKAAEQKAARGRARFNRAHTSE